MISYPPVIINEYLAEKVMERMGEQFVGSIKFFPTRPTTIDTIVQNNPESEDVYVVYDRLFRLRKRAFPHVKNEQLVYYLYKMNGDPETLIETVQVMYDLLDREDESGQEINSWVASKVDNDGLLTFGSGSRAKTFKPIFFHEMRVFHLEEARYIVDHDSTKSFSATKIMINYDYHVKDYL